MQIIMQICQISFLVTSYHPRWGVFGPHGRVYLKCFECFESPESPESPCTLWYDLLHILSAKIYLTNGYQFYNS